MAFFKGRVPAGGFAWVAGKPVLTSGEAANRGLPSVADSDAGPFLVRRPEKQPRERRFDLLSADPVLFRAFAKLKLDEPSILAFANEHGRLGPSVYFTSGNKYFYDREPGSRLRGEPIGRWRRAIDRMRRVMAVWDLCVRGKSKKLADFIHWVGDDQVWFKEAAPGHGQPNEFLIARRHVGVEGAAESPDYREPSIDRFTPGDVLLPALLFVQKQIAEHLPSVARPTYYWAFGDITLTLGFLPRTLADLLWMQFALAVAGSIALRECRQCRRWIRVGTRTAHRNREFCSNACKVKDLRQRKALAAAMHGEGTSLAEIAQAARSNVRTVRGWVANQKGGA
jgi:hypothetical protein